MQKRRVFVSFPGSMCRLALASTAGLFLAGCTGGPMLAPVQGKVSHKGAPVKGGTLVFSPVGSDNPGKAATAEIQPDGTYELTTYTPGDGAILGQLMVSFTPPEQELTEEQRTDPKYIAPPPPYLNLAPKEPQVEVKAGPNAIDIELVPAPPRPLP